MSLGSANNRNDYTGSGSVDEYDFTFKIFDESELEVTVRDDDGVESTPDFTVTGVEETAGGTITLTDGNLASGYHLTIRRVRPLTQETDLRNQGSYFAESTEEALDKAIMIAQQQQEQIDRSMKLPASVRSSDFDPTFPTEILDSADLTIVVNGAGDGFDFGPSIGEIAAIPGHREAAEDAATAAYNSEQAASDSEDAAETAATAAGVSAAASAASASSSSGYASQSATSATAASASQSAASTSQSAASASQSAASTSAAAAASSATSASGSASAASTSATAAAGSATAAAGSATAAASSATAAAGSATAAATSASDAQDTADELADALASANLDPATPSSAGIVSTTTQSFGGNKTFTGTVAASNLSGTNTGDQTITLTGAVTGSGSGSFATTYVLSATQKVYVDKGRADTYTATGSILYPYKTIQAAINAIQALGDNTDAKPYQIVIAAGSYSEALTMSGAGFVSIIITGDGAVTVTSLTVTVANTFNALVCSGLGISTLTMTGASALGSAFGTGAEFRSCTFGNVTLTNLVSAYIKESTIGGDLVVANVSGAGFQRGQITGSTTVTWNAGNPYPVGPGYTFLVLEGALCVGDINCGAGTFVQARIGGRLGSPGGAITVDGNFTSYSAFIRAGIAVGATGTFVNSGSFYDPSTLTVAGGGTFTNNVFAEVVRNVPSGSLAATNVQAALNELQTDIDTTRAINNLGLATSVASNAMTIALKQADGSTNATSGSPVKIPFRSSTITSGAVNVRSVTGALSVVISSGATLGQASAVAGYIYVYAIDNAGTVELAVSSTLYDEGTVVTTTAMSGSATDFFTVYSTTARTSVPLRQIGRIRNSQTTAGTYAANAIELSQPPFFTGRQIVVGGAQTTDGTYTAGTFGAPTNQPFVTFSAGKTGRYKVSLSGAWTNSTGSTRIGARILATAGSPVVVFSQEATMDISSGMAASPIPFNVYQVVWLTAGTLYTFALQGIISAGAGTLTFRQTPQASGVAMIAEQMD